MNREIVLKHFYNNIPYQVWLQLQREGDERIVAKGFGEVKKTTSSIYDQWLLHIGETLTPIAPIIVSYRSIRLMRFTTSERLPSVTIHAYQYLMTHSFPQKDEGGK